MTDVGRGKYSLYKSARVLDQDGNEVLLNLLPLDFWALRGVFSTPKGDLACMLPVSSKPDRRQLASARRQCRRAALDLYQSTP